MLHSKGLQLPKENTFLCYDSSIADTNANVKLIKHYFQFKLYHRKKGQLFIEPKIF